MFFGAVVKVTDFKGETRVRSQRELERRLTTIRQGKYGAFILSHRKDGPSLWVHLNETVAYLHYFPEPDFLVHAGYRAAAMTSPGCKRPVRFQVLPTWAKESGGTFVSVAPETS